MNIIPRITLAAMFAIALVGLLLTKAISENAPQEVAPFVPAAYLANAKYITAGKCKMCHAAKYTAWNLTIHAKTLKQLPNCDETTAKNLDEETLYRYSTGFHSADKTWSELGTSCEACHGPGSEHFKANKENRKLTIMDPAQLKSTGAKVSVCGRCHGQYTVADKRFAENYQPGQNLLTTEGVKLDPIQPEKPMQQMNELVSSKHFTKGVDCMTCHTSHTATPIEHSLVKPVVQLCNQCHADKTMAEHGREAPENSTCATCHMPKGSHTFTLPGETEEDND